jgi:hypothetical protein
VAAVRAGQTYTRSDSGTPGAQDHIHTTVTGKTVFADAFQRPPTTILI